MHCMLRTLCLVLLMWGAAMAAWAEEQGTNMLYVQSGSSMEWDGEQLTLHGVAGTVYFSDRPERVAGIMATEDMAAHWPADDPPNATLSILAEPPVNIVLELGAPSLAQGGVTYPARVLEGDLPVAAGPSTLFIDAFPTPVNGQITD